MLTRAIQDVLRAENKMGIKAFWMFMVLTWNRLSVDQFSNTIRRDRDVAMIFLKTISEHIRRHWESLKTPAIQLHKH